MSFSTRLPARLVAVRPMPVSRVFARGMSKGSQIHGQDPEKLEKEKAKNLSGQQHDSSPHKEHAPGWNEQLASESEAHVKADQAAPKGKPTKEMQEKTVEHTKKHHDQ